MVTMMVSFDDDDSDDGNDGNDDDGGGDCELQSIWPMLSGRVRLTDCLNFVDDCDNCGD